MCKWETVFLDDQSKLKSLMVVLFVPSLSKQTSLCKEAVQSERFPAVLINRNAALLFLSALAFFRWWLKMCFISKAKIFTKSTGDISSVGWGDNLVLINDFLLADEPETDRERQACEVYPCGGGGGSGLMMFWPNMASSGTSAENQVLAKYLGLPAGQRLSSYHKVWLGAPFLSHSVSWSLSVFFLCRRILVLFLQVCISSRHPRDFV